MSTSLPGFCYDFYLFWHLRGNMIVFVKILFIYEYYLLWINYYITIHFLHSHYLASRPHLPFFFSFVSENTANIALLYIIAQILIARYTNGYLHGLFSSVFSVICINFFFTYPFFRLNFTLSGYPVTFIECWSLHCSPQQPLPLFCLMVPSYQMHKKRTSWKYWKWLQLAPQYGWKSSQCNKTRSLPSLIIQTT